MKHRSRLSDSFFAAYALWQVVGALAYFYSEILVVYFTGLALFTLLPFWDRQSLMGPKNFMVETNARKSFELGEPITLPLFFNFVRTEGVQPRRIDWILPELPYLDFEESTLSLLDSMQEADSGYRVEVSGVTQRIGHFVLDKISIQSVSRLGIWSNRFDCPMEPVEIRVHPPGGTLTDAQFSEKVNRQQIFTSGMRRLLKSRAADQFHSVRKYQYPDPQRFIDPKKSAKYNQLMTRTYEEYRSHHLVLLLDCSRNLQGDLEGAQKMDYYISACLKLMETAVAMGDRVSLISFSDEVHYVIRSTRNSASFHGLYSGHEMFQPKDTEPDFSLLPQAISQVTNQRSMVFVLTDPSMPGVYKEIQKNMFYVCQKHFSVVIGLSEESRMLENYVLDLDPSQVTSDQASRLIYNLNTDYELDLLRARINHWGGGIVQSAPDDWMAMTLKAYGTLRSSLTT